MKKKIVVLIALVTLFMGISFTYGAAAKSEIDAKKYEGAWFEIQYPANFNVEPSLKGLTSVNGYDSAFFYSPSKEVAFYVFSPQWNGEPTDILIDNGKEKQVAVDEKVENGTKIKECTISANDGSYFRIYEDMLNPETNTRKTFAIMYKDQKALEEYQEMYKRFKESLVQFAD